MPVVITGQDKLVQKQFIPDEKSVVLSWLKKFLMIKTHQAKSGTRTAALKDVGLKFGLIKNLVCNVTIPQRHI